MSLPEGVTLPAAIRCLDERDDERARQVKKIGKRLRKLETELDPNVADLGKVVDRLAARVTAGENGHRLVQAEVGQHAEHLQKLEKRVSVSLAGEVHALSRRVEYLLGEIADLRSAQQGSSVTYINGELSEQPLVDRIVDLLRDEGPGAALAIHAIAEGLCLRSSAVALPLRRLVMAGRVVEGVGPLGTIWYSLPPEPESPSEEPSLADRVMDVLHRGASVGLTLTLQSVALSLPDESYPAIAEVLGDLADLGLVERFLHGYRIPAGAR